jgi:hypothetical protein
MLFKSLSIMAFPNGYLPKNHTRLSSSGCVKIHVELKIVENKKG